MKKVIFLLLCLGLSGCSVFEHLVYKLNAPQGNYLEPTQIKRLQKGMNKQQVEYLLGTPALNNNLQPNYWYYVYLQQNAYEKPQLYLLTITFDSRGLVARAELNRQLPKEYFDDANNTVIEISEK